VLRGKIIEKTNDAVVLEHPLLGKVNIPVSAVRLVQSDEQAAASAATQPLGATTTAPTAGAAAANAEAPEVIKAKAKLAAQAWKRQVELGGTGSRGDTEEVSLYAAFKANQKDDEGKWAFDIAGYHSEANNEISKSEATAGMLRDWYFQESPWFITAGARYDYHKFGAFGHRLQGSAGPGYRLLKDEKFDWVVRSGLGAKKAWANTRLTPKEHNDFEDDVIPEANIGTQFTWRISARQTFDAGTTFYFDLLDPHSNRLASNADWTIKIDPENSLGFKIGVTNEYNSDVLGDTRNNNFKFYAALVYGF